MRIALAIGLNDYTHFESLSGCVADANEMHRLLSRHANEDVNYSCQLITSEKYPSFALRDLRRHAIDLFTREDVDSAVFYFAGHGSRDESAAALLTSECQPDDPAFLMAELVGLANRSSAREVLIILDCCHSGSILDDLSSEGKIPIREGVSILAACRGREASNEVNGRGIYTSRICEALEGGAADVRGFISVASIYAYVCEVSPNWDARPLLRTSMSKVSPVRRAGSAISDANLRKLTTYFETADNLYPLSPKYEPTADPHDPEFEEIFSVLQRYRAARLLVPVDEEHLYFAAMKSKHCALTPLGKFYWNAVKAGKI